MKYTTDWIFDLEVSPEHADLDGITPTTSIAEVMALIGSGLSQDLLTLTGQIVMAGRR